MRSSLIRWLLPAGLAAAAMLGNLDTASAQPGVRDHRRPAPVPAPRPEAYAGPRQAPPALRAENPGRPRRGFVWIRGHWDWRAGQWQWVPGRWERERARKRWRDARWEQRGDIWVRVDGDWFDDGGPAVVARPSMAPPPVRVERPRHRPGHVWIAGHWDWQNGSYVWVGGRLEPLRKGKRWRQVRWEQRGSEWARVDGDWEDDAPSPYPTEAPPPPREERIAARAGFIWVKGRWAWNNGAWAWTPGRWERMRARQRWIEGRWELRGNRWEWTDGTWQAPSEFPVEPPPPPQPERPPYRAGHVWMPGNYRWIEGRYVWYPGKHVPARPGFRLVPGQWGLRGDKYVFNSEVWLPEEAPPAPAPPPPPATSGPIVPPPPPPAENPGAARAGFVWTRGHYDWVNGSYVWRPGRWERMRAKQRWTDGKWELRGRVWVFVPGGWR